MDQADDLAAPEDLSLLYGAEEDVLRDRGLGTALPLNEAALVCGRHASTLRRHLAAERFPNAHQGAGGTWQIPIADLMSAGLLPREDETEALESLAQIETELEHQREENAELRRLLAAAGSLADERAERIRDLRLSLRLLSEDPAARTDEAPEPSGSPFVWSGKITPVETSRA